MPAAFTFVDNFAIDGPTRKEIRSHVMKGKNKNKARASSSKSPPEEAQEVSAQEPLQIAFYNPAKTASPKTSPKTSPKNPKAQIPQRVGNDMTGIPLLGELNTQGRVHFKDYCFRHGTVLYPSKFCTDFMPLATQWLRPIMAGDNCFIYGTLAFSAACSSLARGLTEQTTDFQYYHGKCLQLLKDQLPTDRSNIGLGTLSIIVGLTMLVTVTGDRQALAIHVHALRRLVALRGGLETLSHAPFVMEKVVRVDLHYAMIDGREAHFARDYLPYRGSIPSATKTTKTALFPALDCIKDLHSSLADAAQDMTALTRYLDSLGKDSRLGPDEYHDIVTSASCTVFAAGALGVPKFSNLIATAIHLALVALLTTLIADGTPYHIRSRIGYDVLTNRTIKVVDQLLFDVDATREVTDLETVNWVLHVIAASVAWETEYPWVLSRMSLLRRKLDLLDREEALAAVRRYPWTNLHDDNIRRMWQETDAKDDPTK